MKRLLLILPLLLVACEREDRESRNNPTPVENPEQDLRLTTLRAGVPNAEPSPQTGQRYEQNAYHVSQGARYFVWFNCTGCHGNGGGGSGPPLMDDKWIYGGEIHQIASTILQGRPNGMPSFRGRIPEEQVWQIAAYVRSMPRHIRKDVAPGRRDAMQSGESPARTPRVTPSGGDVPASAERPQ